MARYRKKPVIIEAWQWPYGDVSDEAGITMIDSDEDWVCEECGHRAHEI